MLLYFEHLLMALLPLIKLPKALFVAKKKSAGLEPYWYHINRYHIKSEILVSSITTTTLLAVVYSDIPWLEATLTIYGVTTNSLPKQ